MNIMLSEILALAPDLQEVPAVEESDLNSFAGLFHQQFPQVPDKESQGIDIKGFLAKLPILTDASGRSVPADTISSDLQLPDPAKIALDVSPFVSASPGLDGNLVKQALESISEAIVIAPVVTNLGDSLPAGGNSLPDKAVLDIAVAGVVESAITIPLAAAMVPGAIKSVSSEVMQKPLTPAATASAGRAKPIVTATNVATGKDVASSDFLNLKDKVPAPEAAQILAKDPPAQARLVADSGQPGVVGLMGIRDFRTDALASRFETSTTLPPQPATAAVSVARELGIEDQRVAATPVFSNLKEAGTRDNLSVRESIPNTALQSSDRIPLSEAMPVRDLAANLEYRNLEMPAQPVGNSSQQSAVIATATVQGASNLPSPALQQNTLPAQLETMSLARNADSTQWGNGLSERINWMIDQKQNTATIRIDPPYLGKLDVQIKIADDATLITIQTQHAQTRDLIESAATRLRDFLQESGYQNVNVDVSQRQDQQQARSQTATGSNADQQNESNQEQASNHQDRDQVSYFIGDGLVDTFA